MARIQLNKRRKARPRTLRVECRRTSAIRVRDDDQTRTNGMSILLQLVKPSVRLVQRRAIPVSVHAPRTAYSTANGPNAFDTIMTTEKGPEVADTALPQGADAPKEPIHWTEYKWSEMSRNAFTSLKAKPVPDAFTGKSA